MIILGLDALDFGMVKKLNCKTLMQAEYGKTDIGGFALERTVVLWASFLTGTNMENEIPVKGQWEFRLPVAKTFFKFFGSVKAIDVPAFTLKLENHKKEHELLAGFFKDKNTIEEFDDAVWKNHEENKSEFLDAAGKADIVMGYFDLADAVGHLSFGDEEKMRRVYEELESLAAETKELSDENLFVVSDHGMKAVGRFGDHTKNGFYSFSERLNLRTPKITDFFDIIRGCAK